MYSQSSEEKFILEYFGSSVGNFLDIGANDGVTFSNTRALALRGWKGVMVEPSPKAYERLKTLYNGQKGFYIYPYAISDHNGKAMLQESSALCSAADVGLVSTLNAEETQRWLHHRVPSGGRTTFEPVEVKCFKWKTFLNRLSIKQFDFVSIDCESFDLEIVQQMDLSNVKLLCVEHNSLPELKKQYLEYTSKFGMNRVIYESGENILICR